MRRTPTVPVLAAALAAGLLCGCSHSTETTTTTTTSSESGHGTPANPSSFPLYRSSQVVTVVPVSSAQMFAAIRASDPKADLPKNFRGHEVIAETGATMVQLRGWVNGLKSAPPSGLHAAADRSGSSGTFGSGSDGIAGVQLESGDGGRSVFVVAADPKRIHDRLGAAFTLIDSYSAVPGVMRGPIDDQAKKQLGYSVTELLDVKSPVGAVIATLKRMQSTDRRAILIIDESRAQ